MITITAHAKSFGQEFKTPPITLSARFAAVNLGLFMRCTVFVNAAIIAISESNDKELVTLVAEADNPFGRSYHTATYTGTRGEMGEFIDRIAKYFAVPETTTETS
jgi:hypothetical protein